MYSETSVYTLLCPSFFVLLFCFFFFSLVAVGNAAGVALHLIHHGNIQSMTEKKFLKYVLLHGEDFSKRVWHKNMWPILLEFSNSSKWGFGNRWGKPRQGAGKRSNAFETALCSLQLRKNDLRLLPWCSRRDWSCHAVALR